MGVVMEFEIGQHVVIKKVIADRSHVDQEAVIDAVYPRVDDFIRTGRLSLSCTQGGKKRGRLSFFFEEIDRCATLAIDEWRAKQRAPKNYGW